VIPKWKFYAIAWGIIIFIVGFAIMLTFVLPGLLAIAVSLIVGFTVGTATAHEYVKRLLPPSE
jgi:hypothetical protein